MTLTLEQAIKSAVLYTDEVDYRIVRLPARAVTAAAGVLAEAAEPFGSLLIDKDEVTLILAAEDLAAFARRLPGHTASDTAYRLLTLDVVLDFPLVGFMARVSGALAAAGVSVMPYAAYSRDHLLIPAEQFDAAAAALRALQASI